MTQQLSLHLGDSQTVCALNASTTPEDGYQSGGAMLAVVGQQNGRMCITGSNPWGQSAWTELRDNRDEGVRVVSAHRVSQNKGSTSGPNMA